MRLKGHIWESRGDMFWLWRISRCCDVARSWKRVSVSWDVSRACDHLLEMGLKILRCREVLIRVFSIFSGGASWSCDGRKMMIDTRFFFYIFRRGIKILRRSNILICDTIKTYLLCFPKYGPLAASCPGTLRKKNLFHQRKKTCLKYLILPLQNGGKMTRFLVKMTRFLLKMTRFLVIMTSYFLKWPGFF